MPGPGKGQTDVVDAVVEVETLEGVSLRFKMPLKDSILHLKQQIESQTGSDVKLQTIFQVGATDAPDKAVKLEQLDGLSGLETNIPKRKAADKQSADGSLHDSVVLKDLVSSTESLASLKLCVLFTETQLCVKVYGRLHFILANSASSVESIWQQLTQLGAVSEDAAEGGELMFMGKLLDSNQTLGQGGVIPKPICAEEHTQYSRRANALLGPPSIRKSTLHVLLPSSSDPSQFPEQLAS